MTTLGEMPLDELVVGYEDAARQHGESTAAGDHVRRREAHEVMARVYRELRRRDLEALRALVPLMESSDTSVRFWSSSHLLFAFPELAEPVLETIGRGEGRLAFDAMTTLRQWRAGGLRFV